MYGATAWSFSGVFAGRLSLFLNRIRCRYFDRGQRGREIAVKTNRVGPSLHGGVDVQWIGQADARARLQALVRIKPRSGQLHVVEKRVEEQPRFLSCDRVTGDDCYVTRLALADVAELDDILLPFHERAETHTSIVKSSIFETRLPPLRPVK